MLALGGLAVVLAACSENQAASESTTASSAQSSSAASVTDVDSAEYQSASYPGLIEWQYASGRWCTAGTGFGAGSGEMKVTCAVAFPKGSPTVKNDVFVGEPNTIRLSKQGTEATIEEGGSTTAKRLAPDHRVTIDGFSCTALTNDGIECSSGAAGFKVVGGTLTRSGIEIAPSTPDAPTSTTESSAPATDGSPMENYTEGTEPVAPGTLCGVSTGNTPVTVVSGRISCTDAIAVIDGYKALPNDGTYGSSNIRMYQGYNCATTTLGMVDDLGYTMRCSKGDIDLQVPKF